MLKSNLITTNLIKARELIADKNNWWSAMDRPGAISGKKCAEMAIQRILGNGYSESLEYKCLIEASCQLYKTKNLVQINDLLGHDAVMKVYDKAVEISHCPMIQYAKPMN